MLRHLVDGSQWRAIDKEFLNFADDARNLRFALSKNDNSIRFVDTYIVFKAPQAVWTPSYETEVYTNLMRLFVNQKEKQKIVFSYNFE